MRVDQKSSVFKQALKHCFNCQSNNYFKIKGERCQLFKGFARKAPTFKIDGGDQTPDEGVHKISGMGLTGFHGWTGQGLDEGKGVPP